MDQVPEVSVSEFVSLINQTFEYAYPSLDIVGELANLRVSKNKWIYFDLKDDNSSVKFFGTVYNLPGPLEDGIMLKVRGTPRLHNLYGFSVNVSRITPSGEGSIKKAAELLKLQLAKEGLFDPERKSPLPYPPARIGLITSSQSAAYADFIKIMSNRWAGIRIELIDVQVQGEIAQDQIKAAIEQFNAEAEINEVLVIIRGGGSPEDLAAFSSEAVTRAVAASRIPTLVAIGHEIDLSLAELAADRRASTPSNAAELLVPDKRDVARFLDHASKGIQQFGKSTLLNARQDILHTSELLHQNIVLKVEEGQSYIVNAKKMLTVTSPQFVVDRGFAIVSKNGKAVSSIDKISVDDIVNVRLAGGDFDSKVSKVGKRRRK